MSDPSSSWKCKKRLSLQAERMRNAKQRRTEREVSSLEENVVQPPEVEAKEVETEPNVKLQPSVEEQQISQELEVETESGGEESQLVHRWLQTLARYTVRVNLKANWTLKMSLMSGCWVSKLKDAGYLPLYELPKETKNERHGCCTRSCLDNWFQ
jgi:protein subunit release factor A